MYWSYPYTYAGVSQRQERVYSEDLLNRNVGKRVTMYLTYENNEQWNAQVVTGEIREVGRDFVLLRERKTGKELMLFNINIDYVVFEEPAKLAAF